MAAETEVADQAKDRAVEWEVARVVGGGLAAIRREIQAGRMVLGMLAPWR